MNTVVAFNTRISYLLSNGIGIVKVLTLVFISITGLVVLGGHTRVPDPHANFVNSFEGKATTYGLTNALYKIIFSYAGFENAFNVVNEVKASRGSLFDFSPPHFLFISSPRAPINRPLTHLQNRTLSSSFEYTASSLSQLWPCCTSWQTWRILRLVGNPLEEETGGFGDP